MLLNGRPQYATPGGSWHLYWTPNWGEMWSIDDDTDDASSKANLYSPSTAVGTGSWQEFCDGAWGDSTLTLTEDLSAANCEALAAATLELPACRGVVARVAAASGDAAEDQPCPGACAELWSAAAERCADQAQAFEEAAPGMTRACRAAAAAALATAPPSITVAGSCEPTTNGRYEQQSTLQNGRPHYTTPDDARYLYWTPRFGGCWYIDSDTDDERRFANLLSTSRTPPTGFAVWEVWCDGAWAYPTLTLTGELTSANCEALAAATLEMPACNGVAARAAAATGAAAEDQPCPG
eukprot:COSAG04_NODE_8582_length_954_cov_1.625731_1_plen_294_part_10